MKLLRGVDDCDLEIYMMPELLEFLERHFLCHRIYPMISKSKASVLLAFISSIRAFLDFDPERLGELRYQDSGKPLFHRDLKKVRDKFRKIQGELRDVHNKVNTFFQAKGVNSVDIRYTIIAFLVKGFMDSLKAKLEIKSIDDLSINPHISTLLGLRDNVRDLIRFNLYQNITRSIVTKWGTFVEELLFYSGSIKPEMLEDINSVEYENIKEKLKKGTTVDLVKVVDDLVNLFQIKSGPNTMNVEMVYSLIEVMTKLQGTKFCGKDVKMLLGMTYGNPEQISSQIKGGFESVGFELSEYTKIGRELWDFIAEEEFYYLRVLEILDLVYKEIFGSFSVVEKIEELSKRLEKEWNQDERYKGKDIWELFM